MSTTKYEPIQDPWDGPPRVISDEEWKDYNHRRKCCDLRLDADLPKAARAWWRFRMKLLETRAYEQSQPSGHALWDAMYESVREKLEGRPERDHGSFIVLHGAPGLGKTVLATGLLLLVTRRLQSARYTKLHRLQRAIEEARQPGADPKLSELMPEYTRPRLLVLDDCSAGYDTDASQRMLRDLLDDRYDANLDTILITNDSKAGFEQFLGPAVVTRINHTGGFLHCEWESFRV